MRHEIVDEIAPASVSPAVVAVVVVFVLVVVVAVATLVFLYWRRQTRQRSSQSGLPADQENGEKLRYAHFSFCL